MGKDKPRVVIIIQARMQSTRLPGKVLLKVLGRPLLGYLLERIQRVKNADAVVVATTTRSEDQPIVDFCGKLNVPVYRGSEEDVLGRYLMAAREQSADVIVRVTADCPLIDPHIIERVIHHYLDQQKDYVGNTLELTFPRGMDTEVFSRSALEKIAKEAKDPLEREHVTLYIYQHPELFRLDNVPCSEDYSHYRLTVDTPEDFALIKNILKALFPYKPQFTLEDVIKYLKDHPEQLKINAHIEQKSIKHGETS